MRTIKWSGNVQAAKACKIIQRPEITGQNEMFVAFDF